MSFSIRQWIAIGAVDALFRIGFGAVLSRSAGWCFLPYTIMHLQFLVPISGGLTLFAVGTRYAVPISLIGANVLFCGHYLWDRAAEPGVQRASVCFGRLCDYKEACWWIRGFLQSGLMTLTQATIVQVIINLAAVPLVWAAVSMLREKIPQQRPRGT